MHGHFRHTPTVLICGSFQFVYVRCSFFHWTRFIWQQCTVRQYHSDLYDQVSAMEIKVKSRIRHRVTTFSHFLRRIINSSTLSSTGNILLKERTQAMTNKIKLHILFYYVVHRLGAFLARCYLTENSRKISCSFLPRCIECRRGLAMRILSVCPSVRLSRVNCDKAVERSVQIPYERTFSLVFWEEEWLVGGGRPLLPEI